MTGARYWTKWEIENARTRLDRVNNFLARNPEPTVVPVDDLRAARIHAIAAWCRTHNYRKGSSHWDDYIAFQEEAPEALRQLDLKAISTLSRLAFGRTTFREAAAICTDLVDALLNEAANRTSQPRAPP